MPITEEPAAVQCENACCLYSRGSGGGGGGYDEVMYTALTAIEHAH